MPVEVRREIGFDLRLVQLGQLPRDWKPIAAVGPGACEIRVRAKGMYRAIYVAKFREGIYVLHAFHKKSRKTAAFDLEVARARYRAVARRRE